MKKKIKLIIAIVTLIILIIIPIYSRAEIEGLDGDIGGIDNYRAQPEGMGPRTTQIVGNILGVVQTIGTLVSVVTVMAIGIRYLYSSPQERSTWKEDIRPYVVGALLLFGGSFFPNLIFKIMTSF